MKKLNIIGIIVIIVLLAINIQISREIGKMIDATENKVDLLIKCNEREHYGVCITTYKFNYINDPEKADEYRI